MPKITMVEENRAPRPEQLDPAVVQRAKRQASWRQGSEEKATKTRKARSSELEQIQGIVEETLDAYSNLADPHAELRLREGGLYLETARPLPPDLGGPQWPRGMTRAEQRARDLRTRKPLARLVGMKGVGLSTYLSMLYTLNAESVTVDRHPLAAKSYPGDLPWALLCGRQGGTVRARNERMRRDLTSMETARVIKRRLDASQGEPSLKFLSETGTGDDYQLPDKFEPGAITLPSSFFTNGWHLVLTQQELLVLLTIHDAYPRMKYDRLGWETNGVALTRHTRWSRYGVSGEAYEAIHELEEFGLIAVHDPMVGRNKGKFTPPTAEEREEYEAEGYAFSPVPYQLKPVENAFDRNALYAVAQSLDRNPLPPRMSDDFQLEKKLLAGIALRQTTPVVASGSSR